MTSQRPTLRPPSVVRAVRAVRASDGTGIRASADDEYNSFFARDAITAALDLADLPEVGRTLGEEVLRTCARLQGVATSPPGPHCNDEEPGKIHHEHRCSHDTDGRPFTGRRAEIFGFLRDRWNGSDWEVTGYTSVDATPLFVRLAAQHVRRHGLGVLDLSVTNRSGTAVTVGTAVLSAMRWIEAAIDRSDLGLLEFHSGNPDVMTKFQTWKDSAALVHVGRHSGELANWDAPIAAIEVQGAAYDALISAAELYGSALGDDAAGWRARAFQLRRATLDLLWMPRKGCFAMGLDRDPRTGAPRQLRAVSSGAMSILNSRMFDDLAEDPDAAQRLRAGYVGRSVNVLWDQGRLLTNTGVRCRSIEHGELTGHADYHGHWVQWGKDAWEIAQGLRHQGFHRLAAELEDRFLTSVNLSGATAEFNYVDPRGRVLFSAAPSATTGDFGDIPGAVLPTLTQAWTATAALSLKWRRGHPQSDPTPAAWVVALEELLLTREPAHGPARTAAELAAREEEFGRGGAVDLARGRLRDLAHRHRQACRLAQYRARQALPTEPLQVSA